MITASNARIKSLTSATVETEIALLNLNIINAVQNNQVQVTVDRNTVTAISNVFVVGTPMTTNETYYKVWQNLNLGNVSTATQNLTNAEMNAITSNFNNLGYTISRRTSDAQYVVWQISW
jgi:tryptophan synthase alpha subunit